MAALNLLLLLPLLGKVGMGARTLANPFLRWSAPLPLPKKGERNAKNDSF